jgi:hypothetical protein
MGIAITSVGIEVVVERVSRVALDKRGQTGTA